MSYAEPSTLDTLMRLLDGHRRLAYVLLFAGSLVETVLPFALIVPGELVFLAGAILAGLHKLDALAVALVLIAGGLAGDNLSYWLGRRYGTGLLMGLCRVPGLGRLASPRRHVRARAFIRRRGALAVFLARFSGPVSWVMPTLAGSSRVPYRTFLRFNTPAVVLGIGQFLLLGYLCGRHGGDALALLRQGAWIAIPVLIAAMALIWAARRLRRRRALCADASAR